MSGAAHLRIVVALLIVGGIGALAPFVASPFFEAVTPYSPFGWVGGFVIAIALWLSRGSIIACNLLVLVSAIGVLFWSWVTFEAAKHSWSIAAVPGLIAAVSAYCLWALAFSKDVRAELDKRAAA
jgi:hypothetical protein